VTASTEPPVPSASSSTRPRTSTAVSLATLGESAPTAPGVGHTPAVAFRETPDRQSLVIAFTPRGSRSRRVPRELLDALENLPKEAARQVAFGQLEHEVPQMPDRSPARLEQPLLETREGPGLGGNGQTQPPEEIAEIVGDDPEQQADLTLGRNGDTRAGSSERLPCPP
jgi:hypothetical protein